MSVNLPLSAQLEKLELLPRAEINKVLKSNLYRWEKITQDDLDDNDDFERVPGWYLYSPDGREVTVRDAIEEIVLGIRLATRIRDMESYRDAEAARISRLFKSWYRAVIEYTKEYGENIGEASFEANEKLVVNPATIFMSDSKPLMDMGTYKGKRIFHTGGRSIRELMEQGLLEEGIVYKRTENCSSLELMAQLSVEEAAAITAAWNAGLEETQ